MSTAASPDPKQSLTRPPTRMINGWWPLLVLLLVWNFAGFLFRPDNSPVVMLPYSVFIEQVRPLSGRESGLGLAGSGPASISESNAVRARL